MNLSEPFVKRPIATVLLTIGIALAGIGALLQGGAGVGHLLLAAGASLAGHMQGIVHGLGAAFAIADGCARLAQPLLQLVDLGTDGFAQGGEPHLRLLGLSAALGELLGALARVGAGPQGQLEHLVGALLVPQHPIVAAPDAQLPSTGVPLALERDL